MADRSSGPATATQPPHVDRIAEAEAWHHDRDRQEVRARRKARLLRSTALAAFASSTVLASQAVVAVGTEAAVAVPYQVVLVWPLLFFGMLAALAAKERNGHYLVHWFPEYLLWVGVVAVLALLV